MRSAIRIGCGLILALSTTVVAQDRATLTESRVDDPAKPDTYVGLYRIKSGEDGGEVLDVDRLKDHTVRITEDSIVVLDGDANQLYVCNYTLRPGHDPTRIDMVTVGGPEQARDQRAIGIIRRETEGENEGLVLLCYDALGAEYPEDFSTRSESEENLFVLEPIPDPEKGEGRDGGADRD